MGLLDQASASAQFRAKKAFSHPRLLDALRRRAAAQGFRPDGLVTIAITNWNTLPYLAVTLFALRMFGPQGARIVVIDNGSTDQSRRFIRRQPDVHPLLLPLNIDHGPALDLAFLTARTEYVVSLDVDAFPVAEGWLDRLLAPLREGAHVAGVHVERSYAHMCCMGMRRERFVKEAHTFAANYREEGLGVTAWDAGELISMREEPAVALFERDRSIGPGWVGTTWEGIAYHNFYAARHRFEFGEPADGLLEGVSHTAAVAAWDRGVREHLGLDLKGQRALIAGFASPSAKNRRHRLGRLR